MSIDVKSYAQYRLLQKDWTQGWWMLESIFISRHWPVLFACRRCTWTTRWLWTRDAQCGTARRPCPTPRTPARLWLSPPPLRTCRMSTGQFSISGATPFSLCHKIRSNKNKKKEHNNNRIAYSTAHLIQFYNSFTGVMRVRVLSPQMNTSGSIRRDNTRLGVILLGKVRLCTSRFCHGAKLPLRTFFDAAVSFFHVNRLHGSAMAHFVSW